MLLSIGILCPGYCGVEVSLVNKGKVRATDTECGATSCFNVQLRVSETPKNAY